MRMVVLIVFILFSISACESMHTDPKAAIAYLDLATAQLLRGQKQDALSNLLKAEKLDPENKDIQNQLGLTYFLFKKYALSANHFQKALAVNANFTEARNNLSRSLIELGKIKEARNELEIVFQDLTYKNTSFAYLNMGLSYFKEGHYKTAIPFIKQSLKDHRNSCFSYTLYARSYYEMNEFRTATPLFDKALPLCQKINFDEAHYYAALNYFKAGERTKGIALMNETILLYTKGEYEEKAKAALELMKLNKM
ncbi:MAG: tetratricopeptide repeat protein [Bdellovibrionaceae bacterium]|nr:tetratricopeptide repeat protein [Pseudobdellovibrionaceae bacterium]